MRIDLYTNEDRARAAMAYYKHEQVGMYLGWCTAGALMVSYCLVVSLAYILPQYIFPEGSIVDQTLDDSGYILQDYLLGSILSMRSLTILGISFAVLWILGFSSAKLIAFYQGVFFAAIFGGVAFLLAWGGLSALGVTSSVALPLIIGGCVGLLVFVQGLLGGFLPDV